MYTDLGSWAFLVGFGYLEGSFDVQHFRASLFTLSGDFRTDMMQRDSTGQ